MPSKGHDKTKGAKGSTSKPMKHVSSGEKPRAEKLQRGPETPEVSPGGQPGGQVQPEKY